MSMYSLGPQALPPPLRSFGGHASPGGGARRPGPQALQPPSPGQAARQGGFTLLEILVAVFIVAVAFTSLLGLHGRSVKLTIRDQSLTRATLVARGLISDIEHTVATQGLDALGNIQGIPQGYPDLRYEVEVRPTELEELRMVIVRVIWDESTPDACKLVHYVREQAVPS
jgi:prepilin-type N-terminal cleavage/methylation domain-containing protein